MNRMSLIDRMRAQYVNRWNTVHLTHSQSLAEHSFNVAMITQELCDLLGYGDTDTGLAVGYALLHDIDEVVTGDIPTPTKRRIEGLTNKFVFNGTECPSPRIGGIVKMADMMETTFQIYQHASGVHADQVKASMMKQLEHKMVECGPGMLQDAANSIWRKLTRGKRYW